VLVVGLVLAASIPLVWALMTPPRDAGTLSAPEITAAPSPATADAVDSTGASREVGDAPRTRDVRTAADGDRDDVAAAGPRPGVRSARIADLDQAPTVVPVRLRIPSIGVDAPVVAVDVEPDGEMEVPDDVRDAGWYRHGPAPGEPGAAVIAGHVDSREQGRGAFFDLRRLDVGAQVKVTDADGNVQRFDVVARRTYDKAGLPADALFTREGRPQLVLITCGGDFDREARSYRDNVVIYAQPSAPTDRS
jgi:sortase (surface protein transpeptidase)